jgi:hypothetical protein
MVDTLDKALERDKVMSLGQCLRHYGLHKSDLRKRFILKEEFLAETNYSRHERTHLFVCRDEKIALHRGPALRHLAGLTEMRLMLKADPLSWHNHAERVNELLTPDGVWHLKEQKVATEYDTGSYSLTQLKAKMKSYRRRYTHQVWGTPSARRVEKLESLFADLGLEDRAVVLHAPWW